MNTHKKHLTHLGTALLAAGFFFGAGITVSQAATLATSSVTATAEVPDAPSVKDFSKLKRTLKKLNLTSEQQTQVDQLIEQARPQTTKIQKEMKANMMQMKELTYSTNYDAKQVATLANRQGELFSQMLVLRAKLKSDIYKKLTPEQQQQLRTMMEEKRVRKDAKKK